MDAVAPAESDAVSLDELLGVCAGVEVEESEGEALELDAALLVAPSCEGVPPLLPVVLRDSPRGLALPLSDGSNDTECGGESEGGVEGEAAGMGDAAPDALPPPPAPEGDGCAEGDSCKEGVQPAVADIESPLEAEGGPVAVGEGGGVAGGVGVEAATVPLPTALAVPPTEALPSGLPVPLALELAANVGVPLREGDTLPLAEAHTLLLPPAVALPPCTEGELSNEALAPDEAELPRLAETEVEVDAEP